MVQLSWKIVSTKGAMFLLCMIMEAETVDAVVVTDILVVMVGLGAVVVAVILVDVVDMEEW
jgi:hypothetical protein